MLNIDDGKQSEMDQSIVYRLHEIGSLSYLLIRRKLTLHVVLKNFFKLTEILHIDTMTEHINNKYAASISHKNITKYWLINKYTSNQNIFSYSYLL
jgi:hypothetical protein